MWWEVGDTVALHCAGLDTAFCRRWPFALIIQLGWVDENRCDGEQLTMAKFVDYRSTDDTGEWRRLNL